MKTALLFGTFDLLHPGHMDLFRQIRELEASIAICLTQDSVVRTLKGQEPVHTFEERKKALETIDGISHVIPGDEVLGSFLCIEKLRPDLIGIGYDQEALAQAIRAWMDVNHLSIPIVRLQPFHPETYKSSFLRNSL